MALYTKANYEQLILILKSHFGLTVDYVNADVIAEFIYAEEMPLFRLVFVEATGTIAIAFHVAIPKCDAFEILDYIRSQMPLVKTTHEYIVDDTGQTLIGNDAYIEYTRKIEEQAIPNYEEIEYDPEGPVTYSVPHVLRHAQDPKSIDERIEREKRLRFYGKFNWDEDVS